jgi:hypothetical protein
VKLIAPRAFLHARFNCLPETARRPLIRHPTIKRAAQRASSVDTIDEIDDEKEDEDWGT